MGNLISSNTMAGVINQANQTLKFYGSVVSANNSATAYYFKPAVKCKLVNAAILVQTAAGANQTATGKITKETAVTDGDLLANTVTISTNISAGTAVDSDDLMQNAVADTASVGKKYFYPGANYGGTVNTFDPANNDCVLITFNGGSNATVMAATLELEFLPVI